MYVKFNISYTKKRRLVILKSNQENIDEMKNFGEIEKLVYLGKNIKKRLRHSIKF